MRNYDAYFERMSENLNEKLDMVIDLIKKTNKKTIIDFGCANGVTTEALASIFPDKLFIGIDISRIVFNNRKNNSFSNILYKTHIEEEDIKGSIVILSSILHEVYSFNDFPKTFLLDFVGADYIYIRDMKFTPAEYKTPITNIVNIDLFTKYIQTRVDFTEKEYVEFLLKQRYRDNFEAELKEDYFSVDWKEIKEFYSAYGFSVLKEQSYLNTFLTTNLSVKAGEADNIFLHDYTSTTHCKLILSRKH